MNIVEASAVSIDVCLDDDRMRVESLINDLADEFSAVYNENVEMLSIRHYTPEAIERITSGRKYSLSKDKEQRQVCCEVKPEGESPVKD